jgi:hypothetical protein
VPDIAQTRCELLVGEEGVGGHSQTFPQLGVRLCEAFGSSSGFPGE